MSSTKQVARRESTPRGRFLAGDGPGLATRGRSQTGVHHRQHGGAGDERDRGRGRSTAGGRRTSGTAGCSESSLDRDLVVTAALLISGLSLLCLLAVAGLSSLNAGGGTGSDLLPSPSPAAAPVAAGTAAVR